MKRLFLASMTMLSLMATAGCSPAVAQCVGNACGLASAVYSANYGSQSYCQQSCSYTDCSPGHGRHSRRGSCRQNAQSCQVVQSYRVEQCEVVTQVPAPAQTTFATAPTSPVTPSTAPSVPPVPDSASKCDDALAEVNAARAQRGLRPYLPDPVLNRAARKCAEWRAARLCEGHCNLPQGDFTFLEPVYPVGSCAGGCAAWQPSWGFGACAMYDNYTYCGAAWVMGRDGLKYCHLFVR